jgi:peptidoglycan/xylan/chitin deacetylase (PgdA/CDA1 family)
LAPSLLAHRLAKSAALLPGLVRRSSPGLVVLLYHRVGDGDRNIDLSIAAFEEQIAHIASHHVVLPFDEALRACGDNDLSTDVVAVTFDDGTADFYTHALPVLVRYGVPAMHYLVTAPIDERAPYPSWAGASDAQAMTWSQVVEAMSTGLVSVGSHTHTHADLDRVTPAAITEELGRSKEIIEDRTGYPCRHFAYPHAVTSPSAESAVRRYYETAAVGGWKKNPAGKLDRYRITRVPVTRADGSIYFRAKVQGLMGAEALLYRWGGRRG